MIPKGKILTEITQIRLIQCLSYSMSGMSKEQAKLWFDQHQTNRLHNWGMWTWASRAPRKATRPSLARASFVFSIMRNLGSRSVAYRGKATRCTACTQKRSECEFGKNRTRPLIDYNPLVGAYYEAWISLHCRVWNSLSGIWLSSSVLRHCHYAPHDARTQSVLTVCRSS